MRALIQMVRVVAMNLTHRTRNDPQGYPKRYLFSPCYSVSEIENRVETLAEIKFCDKLMAIAASKSFLASV